MNNILNNYNTNNNHNLSNIGHFIHNNKMFPILFNHSDNKFVINQNNKVIHLNSFSELCQHFNSFKLLNSFFDNQKSLFNFGNFVIEINLFKGNAAGFVLSYIRSFINQHKQLH